MAVKQKARFEFVGISPAEMRQIGSGLIYLNVRRWDQTLDVGDNAAPKLSEKYAKHKIRKGKAPIRNLMLNGMLRRDIQVISASRNRVVVGPVTRAATQMLRMNQGRWRMWGISPKDAVGLKSIISNFHPIKAVIVNG